MFNDRARIYVQAGRGGDGGLSFRREKHVPRGGPDGGDGGRGGDVVVRADLALRDLSSLQRVKTLRGGRGGPGRGNRRHGADGETVEIRVPVGTQIVRPEGALVGFRNAGKSSFLRRISNAKPKVADYPFTTIEPVLGTVDGPDARPLTVADVPGLIEGAAEGAGLGHEFLAHLERARLLVHVLDAAEPDLEQRFRTIDRELAEYGAGLDELPQIVVLNKTDLVQELPELAVDDPRILRVLPTSTVTGEGIDELKRALFELCPPEPVSPPAADEDELADFLVY